MQSEPQLKSKEMETVRILPACTSVKPTYRIPDITEDIRNSFLFKPRSLPSKYFYDKRGSQLFEQICDTPEYYPTRTEEKLLSQHGGEIIDQAKPAEIMELGSGNAQKTRCLFDICEQAKQLCTYAPLDICESTLKNVSEQLQSDYNWLNVNPLLGDYHAGLKNLPATYGARLYIFLGGTIGNFYPEQAQDFIKEIKATMQPRDYLLLGADRVKENHLLDAAYNDKQGLTAKFNLNILNVLNRELKADFNLEYFEHRAEFNSEHNRIEMHLLCIKDHVIRLQKLDEEITFCQGDSILTEVSHKFTSYELEELLEKSGLNICNHYEPDNQYYSLILAACP